MMSSRSRSASSEMAYNSSPSTLTSKTVSRISKPPSSNSDSNSIHGKASTDRSPRLVDRKLPKITTTITNTIPEKRVMVKGAELHQQLGQAQVDLKKAKNQLAVAEDTKSRALDELREMKKIAEEANTRLCEAFLAQKRAQEASEVEKFRVDELEQVSIEAAQKRDHAWQLELEAVQRKRSADAEAMIAAKQELERVRVELSVASEARNLALKQAVEAQEMADANGRKTQDLSAELTMLKESIDLVSASQENDKEAEESKWESEARNASESVALSSLVIDSLRKEIERTRNVDKELAEREAFLVKLKLELRMTRDSESQARASLIESMKRIEVLEKEIEIANASEVKASESMMLLTKELEETKMSLEEAKLEISSLKQKMKSIEAALSQSNSDLEISTRCIEKAKIDLHNLGETVQTLKLELETTHQDLVHASEREELAVSNVETLAEEVNSLREKLKWATETEEKSKKALDDLNTALHEVTTEANQTKEELGPKQEELQKLRAETESYKMNIISTRESLQTELDNTRKEIERLKEAAERAKFDIEESASVWNEKEKVFIGIIKMSEKEITTKKEENKKLEFSLMEADEEARAAEEEKSGLMSSIKEAEAETNALKEAFDLLSLENLRVRDRLIKAEQELVTQIHENECLKGSEMVVLEEVNRLTRLLEATSVTDINVKSISSSKTNHNLLRSETRPLEIHGTEGASKTKLEGTADGHKTSHRGIHDTKYIFNGSSSDVKKNSENSNMDFQSMSSSVYVVHHDMDPQYESIERVSEIRTPSPVRLDDGKSLNSDDYDHIDDHQFDEMDNNRTSPIVQKKKKPLPWRFGDLLKMKNNHK